MRWSRQQKKGLVRLCRLRAFTLAHADQFLALRTQCRSSLPWLLFVVIKERGQCVWQLFDHSFSKDRLSLHLVLVLPVSLHLKRGQVVDELLPQIVGDVQLRGGVTARGTRGSVSVASISTWWILSSASSCPIERFVEVELPQGSQGCEDGCIGQSAR